MDSVFSLEYAFTWHQHDPCLEDREHSLASQPQYPDVKPLNKYGTGAKNMHI